MRRRQLACSHLMIPRLGLFVTPMAYQKSKKANKERSLAVLVQARGSTVQFCSASNAKKKNINSLKKDLKVIL